MAAPLEHCRGLGLGSIALAIACLACGCGGPRPPDRSGIAPEQAVHGHWVSTKETVRGPDPSPWEGPVKEEIVAVETDLYVNAEDAEKTWLTAADEATWRTVSSDTATGEIVVELTAASEGGRPTRRRLRIDASRSEMLEMVSDTGGEVKIRTWTYIDPQPRP
jgi:hypothetical protein